MSTACIIVAAGSGRRYGSTVPKQFVNFKGKPLFLWSVLAFKKIREFSQVIVVVPAERLKSLAKLEKEYGIEVIAGGKERHDSVINGIKKLNEDITLVAIHDGARPMVSSNLIVSALKAAKKYGASVVAVKARDTIKIVESKTHVVRKTIPRDEVWLAQTPQVFSREIIDRLYTNVGEAPVTDDSQLAEKLGIKVRIVEGSYSNIKITDRADLETAQIFFRKGK
jgi:2-C-methyl-D-erythritol 4-phosphate cytidylyltransferase